MGTSKISGKGTAVVTGASAGLGKVYADRLAREGYDVLLIARREDRLQAVADDIRRQHGVRAEMLPADLSLTEDIQEVAARIEQDPSITFLINNAGTSKLGSVAASEKADEWAMIQVNVVALTRLTTSALKKFLERDFGTIVNIGSVLGFESLPISSIYSGTKAYVHNFTRGVQDEVKGTNVTVQLVAPAATATEIWAISGVPLSNLDPNIVMTAEDCVESALAGLALGEAVTLNAVEDTALLVAYDEARLSLLGASQTGRPASRYGIRR